MSVDQHKEKRVELVLRQLDELPTLPAVALQVLEITGSDEGSARDVVRILESDPSLTARILKLVNSASTGTRGDVASVDRAVVLMGFEAVRSAALAVSLFQTFEASSHSSAKDTTTGFSREAFWRHSIAVATCAELIAKQLPPGGGSRADPSQAFVCGLLHDVGKVAMDACLPKSFAKVVEASELLRGNIADIERQIIGLDHMVIGKRLSEHWRLPITIRDCIWLHGQLPSALPATVREPRLVNLVTLADDIVRENHLGFSGNFTSGAPRAQLLSALGLSETTVTAALVNLVGHVEQRSAALGLGKTSSGELYQEAIRQANRELGRVSTQLAARNKKLVVRAKFFDALAEFHGALTPDAPPAAVLSAVAETAMEALDVTSAAAFSIPPGQGYAEIVIAMQESPAETALQASLCDCPHRPTPTGGLGTAMLAGSELEFALSAVSPQLSGGTRYWLALMAEGICVGGVIWGTAIGAGGEKAETERLAAMGTELTGLASGWSLALRTAQVRDGARLLAEQLAEANRNLQGAQSEIMKARTLMTISEMAAGAAHEMNNPLAVISGRSQLLAATLTDEKSKRNAQQIVDQSHRLSGMITELMAFAKPDPPKPVVSDLSEIITTAVADAQGREGQDARTVEVLPIDVPKVSVDPKQVSAAIAEIVDNALQATEVTTGHVSISAGLDPFGGKVVLTVTDDGVGMDEQTLRRAFDPFFSSKPAGRRRGMGLAKAQRWIDTAGGSIRVESRPKAGTRVIVLLPATSEGGGIAEPGKTTAPHRIAG